MLVLKSHGLPQPFSSSEYDNIHPQRNFGLLQYSVSLGFCCPVFGLSHTQNPGSALWSIFAATIQAFMKAYIQLLYMMQQGCVREDTTSASHAERWEIFCNLRSSSKEGTPSILHRTFQELTGKQNVKIVNRGRLLRPHCVKYVLFSVLSGYN